MDDMHKIRQEIDELNFEILRLLNERAARVEKIGMIKREKGLKTYDPARESDMLARLLAENKGPFPSSAVKKLFKEIFSASRDLMEEEWRETLVVSRKHKSEDTLVALGDQVVIGGERPVIIAGPCSVESFEQMERICEGLIPLGIKVIRGGAYKPRTSPYSFQGLGADGLAIFAEIKKKYGLKVVTEVLDCRDIEAVSEVADVLQIGARNMYNYELLKEVGRQKKPVLLKRSFSATIEELILAAEYVMSRGNSSIILCERGIRTFERWTRNTLDISAIPLLARESHLPVIVDVSHATGRRDILLPVAKAALAAGAKGIMVEVHYNPDVALSDNEQQLDLEQFSTFFEGLGVKR
ncbi:MAG: bifunctional 3-deoxy-7-phosphoheptulonate synthase/chorismate mutase [Candidatus Eremiobacteraeota bacterium]|nr:bifunctional 3-deoxy-7-phosphoheptulonate synthase/chorismate mutase [Candidatus Eremiobacteraeota bacterium]